MKDKIGRDFLLWSVSIIVLFMPGFFYALATQSFYPFHVPDGSALCSLIANTLFVAVFALILAVPCSISLALFAGEYYRGARIARWIKNILDVSRSIPSIIWGIGGYFVTQGWGVFAVPVVLAVMIIPYASALLIRFIGAVPRNLREEAYSLGATPTEVITQIVLPCAKNSIIATYLLAVSRILGETMIVVMLAGETATSVLFQQFLNRDSSGMLFPLALGLFAVTAGVNCLANYLIRRNVL